MSGWNTIKKLRTLEDRAYKMGMKFAPYRHDGLTGEHVALVPCYEDSLPIYIRDAILFAGSIEDADQWMQGVLWAREYDRMTVDKKLDNKRVRKEQDLRNKQLIEIIKNSDKQVEDVE
jgi:hypothetical protein